MRHLFFQFLFLFALPLSAQEVSEIKVTYSNQDASLEEIFDDLEAQYGIRFSYATAVIESKVMDADFENEPIEIVLEYLLSNESMEYKIVSNNVLLRKSDTYVEAKDENYKSSLHLKGRVTNSHDDAEVLNFATISISNSSIGTFSDEDGRFDIEIPEEYINENIVIHYLGYEDEVYKISELEDEFLMVSLKEGQFSIEEVMIVNKEKPLKFGNVSTGIQLNKTQINSATSGVMGNDIGRQIQLLPGISAHDDNSAAIKIRGSNSDETLMILDGMPIYNANHYYGIFSGVNTAYIDSVNIFKNTYPLHYGGKTAGLVELFSDNSQPNSSKVNLNLDLLTASGDVRIPISSNSQLSIAGRSTLSEVNNQRFNTIKTPTQNDPQVESFSERVKDRKNDPSFTFYDLNAKYQYQNEKNDLFSINFFTSSDEVKNNYNTTIQDLNDNELKLLVVDNQSWSNTAGSIMFSKKLSPGLRLNTTAYFTQYSNDELNDLKLDKKYKKHGPNHPPNDTLNFDLGMKQKNELLDMSIDNHVNFDFKNSRIKLGVIATHHDVDYLFTENDKDKFRGKDKFYEMAGYVGYSTTLWDKVYFSSGLRTTYFSNLKTSKSSPRISLNYQVTERLSLKTSFNIENQVIRQFYYEYRGEPKELWVSAGQNDIPVLRSQNVMLGSTLKLDMFSIDVELYQKDMKGHLEYLLPNPGEASNNADQKRDYKLFKGDGLTRGIDVILSSGYKNYDTYLSYTWSKSEQRFKEIYKNQFFASENDRTHQFKWVNTFTYGKFTWGINAIYVSGRPYTDISLVGQRGDVRDFRPDDRLRRVRAYHRVDFSTSYAFNLGKFKSGLTASVFNLMNTKNVKYIQSVATQVHPNQKAENIIIGNESELLNRTFNLGLHISF